MPDASLRTASARVPSDDGAAGSADTVLDRAVRLAAAWIEDGRRIDMQQLAAELGVSRVTLFRHVGGRDALIGAALWRLTERTLAAAQRLWERDHPASGVRTVGVMQTFNALVSAAPGLRRLLDDEPALAIRVLTDPRGRVQTGTIAALTDLLRRDEDEAGLVPLIEPGALAYALVRIGESFLYADVLASRTPDVETANRLQRALIEGGRNA